MLRRFLYSLEKSKLITKSYRRFSEKKVQEESRVEKGEQKAENKERLEENPDEYEDYGDVKIRRGGRKIRVDEEEASDSKEKYIYLIDKILHSVKAKMQFLYFLKQCFGDHLLIWDINTIYTSLILT